MAINSARRSLRLVFFILLAVVFSYLFFIDELIATIDHSPIVNATIIGVQLVGVSYAFIAWLSLLLGIKDWQRFKTMPVAELNRVRLRGVIKILSGRLADLTQEGNEIRSALLLSLRESLARRIAGAEYLSGLLVGLGLLGTFIGLVMTMGSIKSAIEVVSSGTNDISQLLDGLAAPLGGMSAAFTASLLGLLGSLVMGLIAHTLGSASDYLYAEIDDWAHSNLLDPSPVSVMPSTSLPEGRQHDSIAVNVLRSILKTHEDQQRQQGEMLNQLRALTANQEQLLLTEQMVARGQQKIMTRLDNQHNYMASLSEYNEKMLSVANQAYPQLVDIATAANQSLAKQDQIQRNLVQVHDELNTANQQRLVQNTIQTQIQGELIQVRNELEAANQHNLAQNQAQEQIHSDLTQLRSELEEANQYSLLQSKTQEQMHGDLIQLRYELEEANQHSLVQNKKQDLLIDTTQGVTHSISNMRGVLIEATGHLNADRIEIGHTFKQVADTLTGLRAEMQGGRQQLLTLESVLRQQSGQEEAWIQAVRAQNNALLECVRQITEARTSMLATHMEFEPALQTPSNHK